MSPAEAWGGPGALEERRRMVRRDLEELAQQVAEGEMDAATAAGLEAGYRTELAQVEQALAARPHRPAKPRREAAPAAVRPARRGERARSTRRILWIMAGLVVVLTGVIVFLATRPDAGGAASTTSVPADVPDDVASLEAAVAANPDVNAMQLALASWYFGEGDYAQASEHYLAVLHNDPTSAEGSEALARLGWMAFESNDVAGAVSLLEQAIDLDPVYGEARLFYGVVLLYGRQDPAAALPWLEEALTYPDLTDDLRSELQSMVDEARGAIEGGEG